MASLCKNGCRCKHIFTSFIVISKRHRTATVVLARSDITIITWRKRKMQTIKTRGVNKKRIRILKRRQNGIQNMRLALRFSNANRLLRLSRKTRLNRRSIELGLRLGYWHKIVKKIDLRLTKQVVVKIYMTLIMNWKYVSHKLSTKYEISSL